MKTRKIKIKKGGTLKDMNEKMKENLKRNIDSIIPTEIITQKSNQTYSSYLENVNIDNAIKIVLMERAFKSPNFFHELYQNIHDYLPTTTKKKWVDCVGDCYELCSHYIKYEVKTTPYILRALANSVIGDKQYQLTFTVLEDNLTGYWENDQHYIKINTNNPSILHHGRLIFVFGPPSSGKTHNVNNIIQLMALFDPSFPKMLLSIDGSIYRKYSAVYQAIIDEVKSKGLYDGISNLVTSSIFGKKLLFKTDYVKDTIKAYLKEQKKHGFIANLYVPESLAGCIGNINCKIKLSDYINITGDKNWIGVMTYQHTSPDKCPYHKPYKCSGTVLTGKSRELIDGRKYSSVTWYNSYRNGLIYMKKSPNYRFMIHNSGDSSRTTIFQDLSIQKIAMSQPIIDFFKQQNWLYIDGDIKQYPKCHLFRNDC